MRVVHVVTAFPRQDDDPITPWLVQLIRRQRDQGIDASVLAPAYRGGPRSEGSGLPVRRFRYAPAFLETLTHEQAVPDRIRDHPAAAMLVPPYLAAGCREATRLGRDGPDLVHVHWPMPHALFGAAMRRASGGRTAVICSFYSVEVNWVSRRMPWLGPFLDWTIRTGDAVTAISSSTAHAVNDRVDRPVSVIPYSSALPEVASGQVKPALDDPQQPLRLLFVGRLVERKGVEVLVRALARLRHHREAELVIVGAGNREGSVRQTAAMEGVADHVHMLGFVSPERLAREYADADIFVLPAVRDSRGDTEGLGVVLLEAMAYERPVIASRAGGIPDIVVDGETGWLADPGDSEVLSRLILEVASDPEAARRVAARGKQEASTRFAWEHILEQTNAVYESAVRARHGRRD
ncbi:MAG: glycosyltransferase family 4 protein [Candidatus Palauibacterales bacterium]|nr:glycosyltransferase family 4 protein [Candidatus Palauibacterales bacterium]